MVVAPARNAANRIVGAIGVIGPTRINYGRIIPVVDYTARVIGRLLGYMSDNPTETPSSEAEAGPQTPESLMQAAVARIAALEAERDEMRDKWMRAEAETQNVRTRARRDVDEARQFAVQKFATDVVEAAENLRRGLDALPPASSDESDLATKLRAGFAEGDQEDDRDRPFLVGAHELDERLHPEFELGHVRSGLRVEGPRLIAAGPVQRNRFRGQRVTAAGLARSRIAFVGRSPNLRQ
eukprot:gene15338-biopygen13090